MKRCSSCRLEKAEEDFHRDRYRPDGFTKYCKTCRKVHAAIGRPTRIEIPPASAVCSAAVAGIRPQFENTVGSGKRQALQDRLFAFLFECSTQDVGWLLPADRETFHGLNYAIVTREVVVPVHEEMRHPRR